MLTDDQVRQFELFGFVVLRNIFTEREVATLQAEFEYGARRTQESEGEFDGTETHTFSMLGEDTPFYSSLLEDPRFYGPASQLFGDDVFGLEINSYRYVTNTPWHFNDGSPNIHGYGPKYQFPVFEPTRADTGALRFVPGSHKDPWQSELTSWWPLARDSAGVRRAWSFSTRYRASSRRPTPATRFSSTCGSSTRRGAAVMTGA